MRGVGPLHEAARRGALAEAQTALSAAQEAWRSDPRCAGLLAALAGPNPLADRARAEDFVHAFVSHVLPALFTHPLGQLPMRYGRDGGVGSLLMAREGKTLLSLIAREPGRYERRAVGFDEGARHEIVLAGKAGGRLVSREDGALRFTQCTLERGTGFALDPGCEALLVDEVEVRLVSLRLDRLSETPSATREYSLETGELLHQSTGDPQESRLELALAVLGRMERADAAPEMAAMTHFDSGASDHLRWQALRECIALDTAAGLAALRQVAGNTADSLNRPAEVLFDQLCAAHPELAELEAA
jgi:hypothetical protein